MKAPEAHSPDRPPRFPFDNGANPFGPLGEMTATGSRPPPPVPDHELLHRIGRGSYGEVWLARNVLGTYRAVKVVYRAQFTDPRPYEREYHGIQRFEPVSRSHEGLMDVLQVGRNDEQGYFYYVMELADNAEESVPHGNGCINPEGYSPMTLSRFQSSSRRLSVMECVKLGAVLASALARLHQQGLIHRDVKPSNIIFSGGVPKLADIGLVTDLSESCSYVGTEGFIPPEGPNSRQADIYSLGKVLYELAMGKDRLEFPEPPTCLEDSPERETLLELNAVLMKACDADIRRRYQTAEEMGRDLLLIQEGKSVRKKRSAEKRLRRTLQVAGAATMLAAVVFLIERILVWRMEVLQARSEAISPALRGKVQPRDPATPREMLDLSRFYNASLTEPWYPGPPENTLAALGQGVHAIGGVSFDVRGIVQLSGRELQRLGATQYPRLVNNVMVGRWVKRLHLLGGVVFEVMDGREVGRVTIQYTDGDVHDLPWTYGRNVRALWQPAGANPRNEEALPVWTGQNAATRERNMELRLYKFTWENPHPDKEVLLLEFASAQLGSAPFLIAATVEEHQPVLPAAAKTDLAEQLQAVASRFQVLPAGPPVGERFRTLVLNRQPAKIGDALYDGFRFTVPVDAQVDLVWALKDAAGLHMRSWYILPMKGRLKTGFEDWHHGCSEIKATAEIPAPELCLQFLDGRKLRPGAEYFIWFQFADSEPAEVKALLAFPPSGQVEPNRPETIAEALQLRPLLNETPLQFHRHYCLANW